MKRVSLLLFLLTLAFSLKAQTPDISPKYCAVPPVDSTLSAGMAARDNLWPGFGTGSRRQADMSAAVAYRTADALGLAVAGVGVVVLTATALQRSIGPSTFGSNSKASYVVFGSLAAAGVATLTVSRILAVRHAREYDLFLFPEAVPGGAALSLNLQF